MESEFELCCYTCLSVASRLVCTLWCLCPYFKLMKSGSSRFGFMTAERLCKLTNMVTGLAKN